MKLFKGLLQNNKKKKQQLTSSTWMRDVFQHFACCSFSHS